jgi:MFS family permease
LRSASARLVGSRGSDRGITTATARVRPGQVLAAMSGGLAVVVAAQAMLNVGLPDLARATGATQTDALWIVNAHALVFAALLLPASAFGDLIGRRRTFLAGLLIFGGFSAATALVTDPTRETVAARPTQACVMNTWRVLAITRIGRRHPIWSRVGGGDCWVVDVIGGLGDCARPANAT